MKDNKYIYYWVIQVYYSGYGWEDESFYNKAEASYSEVLKDLREYNLAERAPHRIIERRELNKNCSFNRIVEVAV